MTNDAENPKGSSEDPPLDEDELRRRAERLIAEGRMPSFEDLLATIQEVAKEMAEESAKKPPSK